MFTFTIVSRMNTRSTSYSKRSILAAIHTAGLQATQSGSMLTVHVPTLEARRALEHQLQLVDRNVAYHVAIDPKS
jgi:hypothetical protein